MGYDLLTERENSNDDHLYVNGATLAKFVDSSGVSMEPT